jgi:uncharacterized membrane protein
MARRWRRLGELEMDKTRIAMGLVLVAAIGTGIVAGVFFAFSSFVMTALERIPPAQGVAAMNSINVAVINPSFISAIMGTGALCLVIGVGSLFIWNQVGAGLVLSASLVYLLGCFGTTVVLNAPLNNQLASITDPTKAIAFWAEYVKAWTTWNHVRTIAATLLAILLTAALCRR